MTDHATAAPSSRWCAPTYNEAGGYWKAEVRAPLTSRERAVGTEPVAFGPTEAACVAETARIDRQRERLLP
ncbi:hypothetical protein GCM10023191_063350 [Actinoallomurus oryzae]|uniref:Uncharacterized protein n=1 Tax=Actinoallomurus oryzae TaxID=502180 RepID=A0ABP8QN83_9ACTN